MTSEQAAAHEPEHGFEIIVNATKQSVHDANVTFEEVVELAFPGGLADENNIFRVEFENAASKPHDGALVKGGHTQVHKRGTEFSVFRSVRS